MQCRCDNLHTANNGAEEYGQCTEQVDSNIPEAPTVLPVLPYKAMQQWKETLNVEGE